MPIIEFINVTKSFSKHSGHMLLRDRLAHWLKREARERFYALKHVSFQLERGEGLAVVGPNGAGKSTLLGLVAGLATPDQGTIAINGRVAALLELGSGFHGDLSGAENVLLNAALLGISRKRAYALYDEIVNFSGIGDFVQEPLRTYSTGMVMRLAFSVAVHMDPEILLIDEVLAVGDQNFQVKCFDKIRELRQAGKTLLCVSHASGMVQEICDQAIWLDHGEIVMSGRIQDVINAYSGRQHATA